MKITFEIKIEEEFKHPSKQAFQSILNLAENIASGFKERLDAIIKVNLDFKEMYEKRIPKENGGKDEQEQKRKDL